MGYYYDARHGSNAPGDVSLTRNLDKGAFDMIIGGHSHDPICVDEKGVWIKDYQPTQPCKPDFQNGTWIMPAFEWGKYVGRADFEFKNGELKLVNYQLIPVNLKKKVKKEDGKTEYVNYAEEIPQDPEMEKLLKSYQDKGDALLSQKVGKLNGKLEGDRTIIRFEQTNLGHLIAEAQRQKAKADIGIMNSGGIRDSIQEGDVTYKDILKIHPFGNIVSYFELTGKELLDYLNVVALKEVDSGAYAQYSGISMTVNRAEKKVENVKIQGKPLDLNKTYRISLPSYNAAGGDGYPVMTKNPTFVNTGFIDADVLKEFFEKNDIHIHIPEGAVPKDGPSAGVTMATAMLSAITGIPVRADVAMTGEITLRGRVLPIGGLKEKILAAKMAHMKKVLVPDKNRPDIGELAKEILDGLEIVYVSTMKEVLDQVLKGVNV